MIVYKDKRFKFIEWFNEDTGVLVRSDVLYPKLESVVEPYMRSYPELLDIGIMGHCHIADKMICYQAGVDCYQNAINIEKPNMSLSNYKKILKQSVGRVFQIALGGAGDPNKHDNFEEILYLTRTFGIVPNMTTSGIFLTGQEIKLINQYCGAVAVSFYSRLKFINERCTETNYNTIESIQRLLLAGCIVNIHFVLSTETIGDAIYRLKYNLFPKGIYALIFILYKPVGLGIDSKVLSFNDPQFQEFLSLIQSGAFPFKIGFDTCHTPALIKACRSISINSIDACEASRFSMYIDSNLLAYPCSFDCIKKEFCVDISINSIEQAWWSTQFDSFREKQENQCRECSEKKLCLGGCALNINLNICGDKCLVQ